MKYRTYIHAPMFSDHDRISEGFTNILTPVTMWGSRVMVISESKVFSTHELVIL